MQFKAFLTSQQASEDERSAQRQQAAGTQKCVEHGGSHKKDE